MITYKTYQEAKIANPECDIVTTSNKWDGKSDLMGVFSPLKYHGIGNASWIICNPTDYCMTVEQFLNDGYKFVEGDHLLTDNITKVMRVGMEADRYGMSVNECNKPDDEVDGLTLVLRAAALEKPQPRTKVEYVMCENLQDSLDKFESMSGIEFYSDSNGGRDRINSVRRLALAYGNNNLYRRIESPITWQHEVVAFLNDGNIGTGGPASMELIVEMKDINWDYFAESDFVEMCHLVASMTDKPGV